MKKVLVILISFVLGICNGFALCSNSKLAQIKKEASNINFSIDYRQIGDNVYYDIYINNITENMYFEDNLKYEKYHYSDSYNGEFVLRDYDLTSFSFSFYGTGECEGKKLINKSMKLPIYNSYYKDELCNGLSHLNVCKKWVNSFVGYDQFTETIEQYKHEEKNDESEDERNIEVDSTFLDSVINFYVKYYYIILGLTIVTCIIIIVIYNKKNNFKL